MLALFFIQLRKFCNCCYSISLLLDFKKDGKSMRREYLTPSKKHLKESTYVTLYIGIGQIDGFVAFVKKCGPYIKHSVSGKVVQDE